ncbi:MAG: Gfo/Idh/MocA family oxidoreductase [Cytophagales bacterium]|nr:Gfo/Idh/MocA family oxidoreductase [Cytophagales bacterium]
MKKVNFGIIGGGLMGREAASAFARWFVLNDFPAQAQLVAVSDLNEQILEWYKQIPSVKQLTTDYKMLITNPEVDVVYVAVPHNLHEQIYTDVLQAGKDLLAEKPFGINLSAALNIQKQVTQSGKFVRCSSEFPFLPGVQRVIAEYHKGYFGTLLHIKSGFHHSSDLDPTKPINWKRINKFCGEIGVMGDLGMHACHVPFRLGFYPQNVYAQLQKIYTQRPDGKGGMAECDTWDNAVLHTDVLIDNQKVPMTLETKRMAPSETNTWYIEIAGTEGGVKYSTKEPKTLWTFKREKEQWWNKTDLGFHGPYPTITGGIFEPGFPDCFQQMLAAYVAEREGFKGDRFGCATVEEAVMSHRLFDAALQSHILKKAVQIA